MRTEKLLSGTGRALLRHDAWQDSNLHPHGSHGPDRGQELARSCYRAIPGYHLVIIKGVPFVCRSHTAAPLSSLTKFLHSFNVTP